MRVVTLKDVAHRAGASIAAVSAVLNGKEPQTIRVGLEARARIRAIAEEMGYVPNIVARSLVTRKSGVLGLAFPYSSAFTENNPFFTGIMSGVLGCLTQARYNVMLYTAIGDDWNAAEENALIDPRVEGVILVLPDANSAVIDRCRARCFPYVTLVYEPDAPDIFAVNCDDYRGGMLATQHLLEQGHTRIAHFVGNPHVATTQPRKQGYLDALQRRGLEPNPDWIVPAGFGWKDGVAAMNRLLELPAAQRPTAIFAANDFCAEGALRVLHARSMHVPEDFSLVGFDDSWIAATTQPPLDSVYMPVTEMAERAAQMLIAQVEGREIEEKQPVLEVRLTVRGSVRRLSA